jgi:hypothetical protein
MMNLTLVAGSLRWVIGGHSDEVKFET